MKQLPIALLAACLLLVETHAATPPTAANLHQLMDKVVRVQTQIVWDVSNNILDDDGNPKASRLSPADWTRIVGASDKVKQAMQSLLQAEHVTAAAPGQKLEGEGSPEAFTAKQVQAELDKNPAAFKAFAQQLSKSMDEIAAAARAKNAVKLNDVAGRIDQECESCHTLFWYPNQKIPK